MKVSRNFIFLFVLICFVSSSLLWAQPADDLEGVFFDMSEFPQWSRDLRRGSIIAFGIFPFAYLLANFGYDMYRYANNGWDRRYAPWPINAAGTFEKSQSEMFTLIGLTAGTAIAFAIVDHAIVRSRRNRLEREIRNIPEGAPVIIRRPIDEDEADTTDP